LPAKIKQHRRLTAPSLESPPGRPRDPGACECHDAPPYGFILLQEMGGEAVPQRMRRHVLLDPGRLRSRVAGAGKLTRGDRLEWIAAASDRESLPG
jgi:hypothetical protein